jgi:hypothetical protein
MAEASGSRADSDGQSDFQCELRLHLEPADERQLQEAWAGVFADLSAYGTALGCDAAVQPVMGVCGAMDAIRCYMAAFLNRHSQLWETFDRQSRSLEEHRGLLHRTMEELEAGGVSEQTIEALHACEQRVRLQQQVAALEGELLRLEQERQHHDEAMAEMRAECTRRKNEALECRSHHDTSVRAREELAGEVEVLRRRLEEATQSAVEAAGQELEGQQLGAEGGGGCSSGWGMQRLQQLVRGLQGQLAQAQSAGRFEMLRYNSAMNLGYWWGLVLLRCAALCCAVLCYAVLCCAVLCSWGVAAYRRRSMWPALAAVAVVAPPRRHRPAPPAAAESPVGWTAADLLPRCWLALLGGAFATSRAQPNTAAPHAGSRSWSPTWRQRSAGGARPRRRPKRTAPGSSSTGCKSCRMAARRSRGRWTSCSRARVGRRRAM